MCVIRVVLKSYRSVYRRKRHMVGIGNIMINKIQSLTTILVSCVLRKTSKQVYYYKISSIKTSALEGQVSSILLNWGFRDVFLKG